MVRAGDLSIVFISYDEPDAEAHWADLKAKFPHAERVHGVRGFVRAHKAAAAVAATERFLTVDADSVVATAFAEHGIDRDKLDSPRVISWPARNAVNQLCYGNGGLKCWPRSLVLGDRTSDDEFVDHTLTLPFVFEARPFSTSHPNGSPLHAFRAAFREGARLSLADGGGEAAGLPLAKRLSASTLRRLLVWCTVGADAENGVWCLYGARLGCAMVQRGQLEPRTVGQIDQLDRLWCEEVAPRFAGRDVVCPRTGYGWDDAALQAAVRALGDELRDGSGLGIVELDAARSRFFRRTWAQGVDTSPFDRLGNLYREGRAFPKDPAKAALNYRIGAMLGNGNAMNNLARLYREGEGVPRDLDEAVQLLLQATAVGNRFAPYHLGRMYRDGWGVARDARRAAALFETAAARGFAPAHRDLGRLHAADIDGGPADPERAYAHFLLAGAAAEAERAALARSLSPDAIGRARRCARSWRPGTPTVGGAGLGSTAGRGPARGPLGRGVRVGDLGVVFISYDEPRREVFWADLRAKFPRAKRVHGIAGLDAAHKEAARVAGTEHFVTVDGDTVVDPAFVDLIVDADLLRPSTCIRWPSRNEVNGLLYGNGAIKLWPRAYVLRMRTHENAADAVISVDFEYDSGLGCGPLNVTWPFGFGTVHCNGSPFQAFRSAFRAAARLCLDRGAAGPERVRPERMSAANLHRLLVWCSVGTDAPNGAWCLYGARLGCFMVGLTDWDCRALNDFGRLAGLWREEIAPRFFGTGARCSFTGFGWDADRLDAAAAALGDALRGRLGLLVVELDALASRHFRRIYEPPVGANTFDLLADMFRRGVGAARNARKAFDACEAGAAIGDAGAMTSLARMLRTGDGCARDVGRAVHLLREATALGNAFAAHELGRMYRKGWGVERDAGRALELFRLAAGRGVAAAEREIDGMSGDAAAE